MKQYSPDSSPITKDTLMMFVESLGFPKAAF